MKAFNTYGCRCNGCGYYAEWCSCKTDKDGNLVEKKTSNTYPETGRPHEYDEGGDV